MRPKSPTKLSSQISQIKSIQVLPSVEYFKCEHMLVLHVKNACGSCLFLTTCKKVDDSQRAGCRFHYHFDTDGWTPVKFMWQGKGKERESIQRLLLVIYNLKLKMK